MPHKVPEVSYEIPRHVTSILHFPTSEVSPYMLPALRIHLIR